jgi:hypothetical protein
MLNLPILKNRMLLAAGGMICGDVCNPPFSSKKVVAHTMNIQLCN